LKDATSGSSDLLIRVVREKRKKDLDLFRPRDLPTKREKRERSRGLNFEKTKGGDLAPGVSNPRRSHVMWEKKGRGGKKMKSAAHGVGLATASPEKIGSTVFIFQTAHLLNTAAGS